MAFLLSAILLSPLIGAFLSGAALRAFKFSGFAATGAVGLSFVSALIYAVFYGFSSRQALAFPWFSVGDLSLSFSFIMDELSLLMTLLITGAGFLIHIYSLFYMSEDKAQPRYFSLLNLFVFMMLILVLASHLPLMFIGWEGVGLCSYCLIGFWFKDKKKVHAGWTAFIANRIGDAGFLLGMFVLFSEFGSLGFVEINQLFGQSFLESKPPEFLSRSALAGGLLFIGAMGKSASWPLHFWLPSAMAGPTPVSALIHSATMVTAGVYMLARLSHFYSALPGLLQIIAWVGAFSALFSALIACRQWNFKKILAYSTISQLAYMFIAVGAKAFSAGVFHLLTHGFFKALLFLCAGSVIHALRGQEDIRQMGGLKKSLPVTFVCFIIGALALVAIPPFSGFFSKDEILWSLFSSGNYALFGMAFFTGLLTAFYMARLAALVFFGESRFKEKPHKEGGAFMKIPLVTFAVLAVAGGALGIPHVLSELLPGHIPHLLHELLKGISPVEFKGPVWQEALLMALSAGAGLLALFAGFFYFLKAGGRSKKPLPHFILSPAQFLQEAFYVPFAVSQIAKGFNHLSKVLAERVEQGLFQKSFLSFRNGLFQLKDLLSRLQNGNLSFYALYFVLGLAGFMALIFIK